MVIWSCSFCKSLLSFHQAASSRLVTSRLVRDHLHADTNQPRHWGEVISLSTSCGNYRNKARYHLRDKNDLVLFYRSFVETRSSELLSSRRHYNGRRRPPPAEAIHQYVSKLSQRVHVNNRVNVAMYRRLPFEKMPSVIPYIPAESLPFWKMKQTSRFILYFVTLKVKLQRNEFVLCFWTRVLSHGYNG